MRQIVLMLVCIWMSLGRVALGAADKPLLRVALMHTFSKADPMCYDPYGLNLLHGVEMAWDDFRKKNGNWSA